MIVVNLLGRPNFSITIHKSLLLNVLVYKQAVQFFFSGRFRSFHEVSFSVIFLFLLREDEGISINYCRGWPGWGGADMFGIFSQSSPSGWGEQIDSQEDCSVRNEIAELNSFASWLKRQCNLLFPHFPPSPHDLRLHANAWNHDVLYMH